MSADGFFSPGLWLIEQLAAAENGINPIRAQIAHIHGRRGGCKRASLKFAGRRPQAFTAVPRYPRSS